MGMQKVQKVLEQMSNFNFGKRANVEPIPMKQDEPLTDEWLRSKMSDSKCQFAEECAALHKNAKEQRNRLIQLKLHADAMAEALTKYKHLVMPSDSGPKLWADDALVAYRKDFPE